MAPSFRYDEPHLVEALDNLQPRLRATFAATCAQRQLPAYLAFCQGTGQGDPGALTQILDLIWSAVIDQTAGAEQLERQLERCMELIPEDDEEGLEEPAYAEDAASSAAYALRCLIHGSSQEAAWAARRAYESLDHYVIHRMGIDPGESGNEGRILAHPLVQAELGRQQRDLRELLAAASTSSEQVEQSIRDLQARARREAPSFFELPP